MKSVAVRYGFNKPTHFIQMHEKAKLQLLQKRLADPTWMKVDFNGINFDRIVLARHGFPMHPHNAHDVYMMVKTMEPAFPSYSQKFAAFYFLRDPHFPQFELNRWMQETGTPWDKIPVERLRKYNNWDIEQLCNLFLIFWDHIITDEYWDAYMQDNLMYEPMLEMQIEGGLHLDLPRIWVEMTRLQREINKATRIAKRFTFEAIANPNSSKQLAAWFTLYDKLELELTAGGDFSVRMRDLIEIKDNNPIADAAYTIRENDGILKFLRNYLQASDDPTYEDRPGWIPCSFSISSARTRRTTSSSRYKINFQNPSKEAKKVHRIPEGELGIFFDSTQVENVVHIYESEDVERRSAYEADDNWNEYVWLCQRILGTKLDKKELDKIPSPNRPGWSLYKQYKTGKLALNFGMGKTSFGELFSLSIHVVEKIFNDIHSACPAIHELQNRVKSDLRYHGYVKDAFGRRYVGPPSQAYKVVAYLIQGCGTGSLPKAQIRANWRTLRRYDKGTKCGVVCSTTHDENGMRIRLDQFSKDELLQLLQDLNYNMTKRYEHKFDGIPLRAKMYLTRTNVADYIETDVNDAKAINKIAWS